MTKEEKELLLKDLCARLPYNVMVDYESHIYIINEIDPACKDIDYITVRIQDVERLMCAKSIMIEDIKPYLRPMSSMTEEEEDSLAELNCYHDNKGLYFSCGHSQNDICDVINFLNSHHFDYQNLIEKDLALEAKEGMYNKEGVSKATFNSVVDAEKETGTPHSNYYCLL